ncbi:MAG TPA: hypothetical protein VMU04_06685, partial [Candidatus Acidoferrum sp.]|nr:hypothetical protein [Candidatus Acidoferrum sp.]
QSAAARGAESQRRSAETPLRRNTLPSMLFLTPSMPSPAEPKPRETHAKRVKILPTQGVGHLIFLRKSGYGVLAPPLLAKKHKSGDSVDGLGPVRGLFAIETLHRNQ